MKSLRRRLAFHARGLCAAALLATGAQAQFVVNQSRLPSGSGENNSSTENVDFADLDQDGDWDVAMADGGDDGNDQNRIWINKGGAQGGVIGFYQDETSTRAPVVSDDSRDIEFVDFDNDSDVDVYVSNTAQLSNQGNRWWTNLGNSQAGSVGFYIEETSSRWVGLGGAGSSIAPSQLIAGTFIDWSCDCDFGDLDNDGDLDLVHSSYGVSFGGATPTRLFLNDGSGHFSEFNPSGFKLPGPTISNGNPGIWCDGTQLHETTNTTGVNCDVAGSPLDIDVGDIDQDFDLDILHGARNEAPRMFANRLNGSNLAPANGGALGFRDVTGGVFPNNYQSGVGHYNQEVGDADGDGDLDIYGLNWKINGFFFDDITLRNTGNGTYDQLTTLANSGDDDNEGDFFDYDNDGDLDLWIADFSGNDRLYRNNNNGGSTFSYTQVTAPNFSAVSLDADCCDTDFDGDYDVLVAEDNFSANTFCENVTGTPDTHAPVLPNVEQLGALTARVAGYPARAHVYDNAPYYITWYNDTSLELSVDGCDLPSVPARSSSGQIFRALIPGNLVGSVDYTFVSSDEYGNTGTSATKTTTATTALAYETHYGTGSPGPLGVPGIEALSVPFAATTLHVAGKNASPGALYVLIVGDAQFDPGVQVGNLVLLHAFGNLVFSAVGVVPASGSVVASLPIPAGFPAGLTGYAQFFTKNGTSLVWASSEGLELVTQ